MADYASNGRHRSEMRSCGRSSPIEKRFDTAKRLSHDEQLDLSESSEYAFFAAI
jgi:hypothetical protein